MWFCWPPSPRIFVPLGQFDTREVTYTDAGEEQTQTVLVPDSFSVVTGDDSQADTRNVGLFEPGGGVGFLNYVFAGLVSGDQFGAAVGVVAFIIIIGGAFGIIMRTGAVETGMMSIIDRTQNREFLIIPLLFFLFSLGGAVFGMGEEAIAFAMILVPIVVALGYDALTGVMITYVATQIGFATSWMNPFGIAIAQGIAGVPVLSGSGFRVAMWLFFTVVGIVYTYLYARRVKADPESSLSYNTDAYFREDFDRFRNQDDNKFTVGHALVLLTVAVGIGWIVWGVVVHAYYIPEIASQFFTIGLVAGLVGVAFRLGDMGINDVAEGFKDGAQSPATGGAGRGYGAGDSPYPRRRQPVRTFRSKHHSAFRFAVDRRCGAFPGGVVYVLIPDGVQLLRGLGLGPGRTNDAADGPAGRPRGRNPAGRHASFPARRRFREHNRADFGGPHGHARRGAARLGDLGPLYL